MAEGISSRWWWRKQRALYAHPSALLLLVQLVEIVLYPLAGNWREARLAFGIVGIAVMLMALRLIHHTRGLAWYAFLLAALAIALEIASLALGLPRLQRWLAGTEALLYFYTAFCLIGYMFADRRATIDELYAAAATLTLLVWAFTQVFVLCQLLQPAAFSSTGAPGDLRSWSELMFLSFALFTSTGIGTTVPMTAAARAIGDIEMFTGVMYLAFVVSRLVGMAVGERAVRNAVHRDEAAGPGQDSG